jgi:hypothetical protein
MSFTAWLCHLFGELAPGEEPKLCIDCRWCKPENETDYIHPDCVLIFAHCQSPDRIEAIKDRKEQAERYAWIAPNLTPLPPSDRLCTIEREYGRCGRSGRLFEPKETP